MCGICELSDGILREGHYGCPQDPGGTGTSWLSGAGVTRTVHGPDGRPLRGTPLCDRWYERTGGVRPWEETG